MSPSSPRTYQQVVLDHGRNPRNFGAPSRFSRVANGRTPGCGDDITVFVGLIGSTDQTIEIATFDGEACAVSRASASLMGTVLQGKPLSTARAIVGRAIAFLEGRGPADRALGELGSFHQIHNFSARQRCALLPWRAMSEALTEG
jgi:nitrogen fixation NifU-like protein